MKSEPLMYLFIQHFHSVNQQNNNWMIHLKNGWKLICNDTAMAAMRKLSQSA